jgi:RNA polymerase sigma-70 factor (ECF subfamily)
VDESESSPEIGMSQVQFSATTAAQVASIDDDRELVERAKRDRQAFALLYRRYYRMLSTYVYRRTGDVHATEDLVSDVFLTVLRTLPRFRYRGVPVRFWFFRIATNVDNRWARRQRRRAAAALPLARLAIADASEFSTPGPIDAERAQLAMLSIAPKFQAVLSLHYLEGLCVHDVAAVIGCREGTVKSRLARARDALRERLDKGR